MPESNQVMNPSPDILGIGHPDWSEQSKIGEADCLDCNYRGRSLKNENDRATINNVQNSDLAAVLQQEILTVRELLGDTLLVQYEFEQFIMFPENEVR